VKEVSAAGNSGGGAVRAAARRRQSIRRRRSVRQSGARRRRGGRSRVPTLARPSWAEEGGREGTAGALGCVPEPQGVPRPVACGGKTAVGKMATATAADVWAHFNEGNALGVNAVSRSEAEGLSSRVAELEDEVTPCPSPPLPSPSLPFAFPPLPLHTSQSPCPFPAKSPTVPSPPSASPPASPFPPPDSSILPFPHIPPIPPPPVPLPPPPHLCFLLRELHFPSILTPQRLLPRSPCKIHIRRHQGSIRLAWPPWRAPILYV